VFKQWTRSGKKFCKTRCNVVNEPPRIPCEKCIWWKYEYKSE
jgi:hypothetical protein